MLIYYQIGAAVIVILFIVIGAFRGIARSILNLIGFALDAVLAYYIAPPLAQWIYDEFIKQTVILKIQESISQNGVSVAWENIKTALPDWLSGAIGFTNGITGQGVDNVVNNIQLSDSQTLEMARSIESAIGGLAVSALTIILVFVLFALLMIVIKLIIRLIIKAMNAPVLRQINKILGAVLGAVEGCALVWFLCAVFGINLFA